MFSDLVSLVNASRTDQEVLGSIDIRVTREVTFDLDDLLVSRFPPCAGANLNGSLPPTCSGAFLFMCPRVGKRRRHTKRRYARTLLGHSIV